MNKRCSHCGQTVATSFGVGGTCPHCGVQWSYEQTGRWTSAVSAGKGFGLIGLLLLLGALLVVPQYLLHRKAVEMHKIRLHFRQGEPAQQVEAAGQYAKLSKKDMQALAPHYAHAINHADILTRAQLIDRLVDVGRRLKEQGGSTQKDAVLPPSLQDALRAAMSNPAIEVREAAQKAVHTLGLPREENKHLSAQDK